MSGAPLAYIWIAWIAGAPLVLLSHVIIGIATLLCRVVLWLGEHIQFLLSHMIIGYPILFMSGRSGEPRNEFKNIVNIKPIYVTVF